MISAFSDVGSGSGCGELGLGSLPAMGVNGNISEPRAATGSDAGGGKGTAAARGGAACSETGSLMTGADAGVSLANGCVYSRCGVMTSTALGL